MLQQQRQGGGLGGTSKLSPSHHSGVGGGPKLPGPDSLPHPGLAGSVADLHQKNLGPYSGKQLMNLEPTAVKFAPCLVKQLNGKTYIFSYSSCWQGLALA